MPTSTAVLLDAPGLHSGLAALGVSDSVSMYPADEDPASRELFRDVVELLVVFPANMHSASSVRSQARASGFDSHEVTPGRGDRDTDVLGTAIELLVRCARSTNPLEPDTVDSPSWLLTDTSEKLALALLSQLTARASDRVGRRDGRPRRTIQRRAFEAARANLGMQVVDSSSKYRPDTCPRCAFRWDVVLNGYVGFERIASSVWKCGNCTAIVDAPMTSNRTVAKR